MYDLVRSLADEGAAVLMFTSELREIGLVCDRAAVLHGGRIVAELARRRRRERPAHRRPRPRPCDVSESGGVSRDRRSTALITTLPEPSSQFSRFARRQGWTFGVAVLLVVLVLWRFSQLPDVNGFAIRTVTAGSMSLAFLAMGQSVIVISGGIDLSVGAKMVFANCLSAMWMEDKGLAACLALGLAVVLVTTALSTVTGVIVTVSGVPDIIVTLAASFMLSGLALFIIGGPGGGTSPDFQNVVAGSLDELLAVGAVDGGRRRVDLDPTAPQPTGLGDLRRRQRSQGGLPLRRGGRPHPRRRRTRSAGSSPASPVSSRRRTRVAASHGRRSGRTPR